MGILYAATRLTSIESSFHPCKFTAIVPGAYPGEAKMCRRLIAETDARSVGVGDSHPSRSVCTEVFNSVPQPLYKVFHARDLE